MNEQPSRPAGTAQSERAFALGQICITPGAIADVGMGQAYLALARHQLCDWGTLSREDWQTNDAALRTGARLLSAYRAPTGVKFWIITEADRSATTILLPEEY